MRGALPLALAGLTALGCAGPAVEAPEPRPPIEVHASVDRAVATVGDRITYTLTVDREPEVEVHLPSLDPALAGLTVIESGRKEIRREGQRVIEEHPIRLRVDQVGSYVLPAVEVGYRRAGAEPDAPLETVGTSPIFVEVESVLDRAGEGGQEVTDIRGLKPLERPAEGPPWPWIAGGAALVALLAVLVFWLRRRRRSAAETPPRPAHEVALERIAELARSDRSDPRAVRRLHFALSEVVRVYVEDRFGLNATDLTTEEIIVALPGVPGLDAAPALELRRFLVVSDRVKFADHQPAEEEILETLGRARGFVESTRPRPEETAGGADGPTPSLEEEAA